MSNVLPIWTKSVLLVTLIIISLTRNVDASEELHLQKFWFQAKEVYPIEWGIQNLAHADLDKNGKEDFIVVENNRAKIHILWNRDVDETVEIATNFGASNINSLPPDSRFKLDAITTERRILDLDLGDLNNDGLIDIAYFGQPEGLIVHFNKGDRKWETPEEFQVETGQASMNSLDIGDLNGDKLNDVIMLAEGAAYAFYQKEDNSLDEPVKLPLSNAVRGLQIQDLNKDGRQDLVLLAWETKTPFRVMWQMDGQLGPEVHFKLPSISAYDLADLNKDTIPEVICIEARSNDAAVYQIKKKDSEEILPGFRLGQLQMMSFDIDGGIGDTFLWVDLNGDKKDDLLVPDPQSGIINYYEQSKKGHFEAPIKFPSFSGITQLISGNWNEDPGKEIFILSPDEKSVGVTSLGSNNNMPFPKPIKIKGQPIAIGFGTIQHQKKQVLVVISEDEDTSRRTISLVNDGKTIHEQNLDEDYQGTPGAMHLTDADHDGYTDIVLVTPYQDIKILRGSESDFDEINVSPPGGSADKDSLTVLNIENEKPQLVFSIKNFVRFTQLVNSGSSDSPNWNFSVSEQVNGSSANSEIKSPIYLSENKSRPAILGLLDSSQNKLSLCTKDKSGTWRISKNIALDIEDPTGLDIVRLGNSDSIALNGENFVSWISQDKESFQLDRSAQYQTKINRGKIFDVITGDFNNNGAIDLLFNEAQLNHLEIATVDNDVNVHPAVNWKVFEKQSFRSGPGASGEPREMATGDFNSDGKEDIAILVHDRIVIYPQD